jgi:GNAT superfamily N-acetyltransferase
LKIIKINELSSQDLSEVIKIFFQTSSVHSFASDEDKELFIYRYFGYYQEYFSDFFSVAIIDEVPVGYICGSKSSFTDNDLLKLQPQIEFFEAECLTYPAHLHININPDFHGKGIGRQLFNEFSKNISENSANGLHIITTPKSDNVKFYQACGFDFQKIKLINETKLLFMGKIIKTAT